MDSPIRIISFQRCLSLDLTYTPYGFFCRSQHTSLVGFAGQRCDAVSGLYPLGNGRRMYSPTVSRFTSPDGLSPFDRGGMNAYAYCSGDPVNYVDPSGRNRYSAWAQARQDRHKLDSFALDKAKFPRSLRPQLEHFRQTAKKSTKADFQVRLLLRVYIRSIICIMRTISGI
ncbi:RHS repeat-associated core domain-containing protein [Pseudomonas sp. NY11955]|uniref:RHS repeat-associated core domain-containing protein n=1 Tax=Pseudomonas sp. NY11955 TaxID=3400363 RepID=UPI003A8702BA